jgi:hypothetical protein
MHGGIAREGGSHTQAIVEPAGYGPAGLTRFHADLGAALTVAATGARDVVLAFSDGRPAWLGPPLSRVAPHEAVEAARSPALPAAAMPNDGEEGVAWAQVRWQGCAAALWPGLDALDRQGAPGRDEDLPRDGFHEGLDRFSELVGLDHRQFQAAAEDLEDGGVTRHEPCEAFLRHVLSVARAGEPAMTTTPDLRRRLEPLERRAPEDVLAGLTTPVRVVDLPPVGPLHGDGLQAIGRHEGPRAAIARLLTQVAWCFTQARAIRLGRLRLGEETARARLHVVGHGAGARAAAAFCLRNPGRAASLGLMWPTLPQDAFSPARGGALAALLGPDVIAGPLVVVHHPDDQAAGVLAPAGGRLNTERAVVFANPDDPFALMGCNGPQDLGRAATRVRVLRRSRSLEATPAGEELRARLVAEAIAAD